jgi:hypothetical protein
MLTVRTRVGKSSVHGRGLFADQDIKEGQLVWEFDSQSVLEFPSKFIRNLNPKSREMVEIYGWFHRNLVYLDLGDAKYMNHSKTPNLRSGPGKTPMVAARDIKKGEELFCDYREICDSVLPESIVDS